MSLEQNEQLLTVLLRTGIFGPEQADEVRQELYPHYPDARSLGEYLVEIDWLTSYQLQMLFAGQWEDLALGQYQVLDRLGEGGISEVLKAWDSLNGRVVALKVLRPHLVSQSDMLRQFQRELQAITRLSHPNIIKTFDACHDGSRHYFAMEFVEGMDLDRFVQQVGPLSVEQACDYVRQVAHGLQHAHQNGLVHRDIKPANLFLLHPPLPTPASTPARRTLDPVVKIIDWGLARCMQPIDAKTDASGIANAWGEEERGRLIGTADYIAPEQAHDAMLADIRADIYSLGCTLYFLLTAHSPFPGSTLMQKLMQHQTAEPQSLRIERPDVPEDLDALVMRMLAKRPEDRPQIPLMVVTPLRRFCGPGAVNGRSGSATPLIGTPRPSTLTSLTGNTVNMPRPQTHESLPRPGSQLDLPRPNQNRPGFNGNGNGARRN